MDINKMPEATRAEFVRAFTSQFGFGVLTASADADAVNMLKAAAWAWQASRASSDELPALTDELLTAAYWDFDARRKGYPPYAAPAGQECGAFKAAIVSVIEAQGLKVKP